MYIVIIFHEIHTFKSTSRTQARDSNLSVLKVLILKEAILISPLASSRTIVPSKKAPVRIARLIWKGKAINLIDIYTLKN